MNNNKIGASDNELENKQINEIIKKIKIFDKNSAAERKELHVYIPVGIYQNAKSRELTASNIYFDLFYAGKRLRFAAEIGKRTQFKTIEISRLHHDEQDDLTLFIITEPIRLAVPEARELIERVTNYFKPQRLEIKTVETGGVPPSEFLASKSVWRQYAEK